MAQGKIRQAIGIVAAAEVGMEHGAPARRVKLLPVGRIEMRDGRGPFLIRDLAHAQAIVAATQKWLGGADFNFDYDHQTAFAVRPEIGGTGVAAGWTSAASLTAEADGIYANDIEWTAAAEAKLAAREYRYISPLFRVLPSGEVERLRNAALVNVGGIDLPAIAAGLSEEDDPMDLTAIAAALGLAATATVEEIAAAAADLRAKASAIAVAAGLAAGASAEDIAASVVTLKARAEKPDLSGYVPASLVEPMKAELQTLKAERLKGKVDALVSAGVVPPAKHKATMDWFLTDEVAASAYFADMPALIQPGAQMGGGKLDQDDPDKLTADEIAACASLGIGQDVFLAEKKLLKGEGA